MSEQTHTRKERILKKPSPLPENPLDVFRHHCFVIGELDPKKCQQALAAVEDQGSHIFRL